MDQRNWDARSRNLAGGDFRVSGGRYQQMVAPSLDGAPANDTRSLFDGPVRLESQAS